MDKIVEKPAVSYFKTWSETDQFQNSELVELIKKIESSGLIDQVSYSLKNQLIITFRERFENILLQEIPKIKSWITYTISTLTNLFGSIIAYATLSVATPGQSVFGLPVLEFRGALLLYTTLSGVAFLVAIVYLIINRHRLTLSKQVNGLISKIEVDKVQKKDHAKPLSEN